MTHKRELFWHHGCILYDAISINPPSHRADSFLTYLPLLPSKHWVVCKSPSLHDLYSHYACHCLTVASELSSLLSCLYLCQCSTKKPSFLSQHNITSSTYHGLSLASCFYSLWLPAVGFRRQDGDPGCLLSTSWPQREHSTSCEVSFTGQTAEGNSEHCLLIKNMSCWMWCCGIWSENSHRSD